MSILSRLFENPFCCIVAEMSSHMGMPDAGMMAALAWTALLTVACIGASIRTSIPRNTMLFQFCIC